MRHAIRGIRRIIALCLLALPALHAHAQADTACRYYATNSSGGHQCYNTLEEAEAFLRNDPDGTHPARKYLERSGTTTDQPDGDSVKFDYRVLPRPGVVGPRLYSAISAGLPATGMSCGCKDDEGEIAGCEAWGIMGCSGGCKYTYSCNTKSQIETALVNYFNSQPNNSGATVSTVGAELTDAISYQGHAVSPQYPNKSVQLNYSKDEPRLGDSFRVDYLNHSTPKAATLWDEVRAALTCPPEFTTNNPGNPPSPSQACKSGETGTIIAYDTPQKPCTPDTEKCSLYGNPVVPSTGAKIQAVIGLSGNELFGIAPTYNSLSTSSAFNPMGQGWNTLLTARFIGGTSDGLTLHFSDQQGNIEVFQKNPSGEYRANANQGLILRVAGSGSSCLRTIYEATRLLVFNCSNGSASRLLRVEYPADPVRNLVVDWAEVDSYGTDGAPIALANMPTTVTRADGRQIALAYSFVNSPNCQNVPEYLCNVVRMTGVMDADGSITLFQYDAMARLQRITYPDYTSEKFEYGASADLCPTGVIGACDGAVPSELANTLLTGVYQRDTLLSADVRYGIYQYDNRGRVLVTTHPGDADRTEFSYSTNGQTTVRRFTNATTFNDRTLTTQRFGSYSKVDALTDKNGSGTVLRATPATTFYPTGYVQQSYDFNGNRTDWTANDDGLTTQRVDAANDTTGKKRTIQTEWDPIFPMPTERRTYKSDGTLVAKNTWSINSRGQVQTASSIDPATGTTRTTTTTYCEQADVDNAACPIVGLLKSVDGPRTDVNDVTNYSYYQTDDATCASAPTTCPHRKGDLWKVTNAIGQVTETLKYDGAGRVLSVKDANGVITDFEYSSRGWLIARKVRGTDNASESDDQITRIDYWPTGLVKKVTQPDGAYTSYTYDAAHRLTDIADNAGNSIHYTLDNAGNRTEEDTKDPTGAMTRTLSRSYDALNQLSAQFDAGGHQTGFTYDANGNMDTVTDPRSHIADNEYDPLNRLSKTLQDVGGIAAQTQFAYDALDNLTQVIDPKGLNTTYTYNGLNDLLALQSPDTGTTIYTYDSAGNRKTQVDAELITATYGYDALNRLTSVSYPTTSLNVAYTYDTPQPVCTTGETFGKGRLAKITDASGSTSYCYDRFGNLVRKVQVTNGLTFVVRYGYDLAGRMISLTYPDGRIAGYTRNDIGRIIQVDLAWGAGSDCGDPVVSTVDYAPFGPPTSWTSSSGNLGGQQQRGSGESGAGTDSLCVGPTTYRRAYTRSLDTDYRPDTISDSSLDGLSYHYGFDAAGNLTQLDDAFQSTILAKYRYDGLNRLDQTQDGPTGTPIETYGYDTTGNRTSFTNAAGTKMYSYPGTSHRLSGVDGVARLYNANGSTVSIGGTTKAFTYDDTGRMNQAKTGGTVAMNYAYNGKGEQVRRYVGATNTYTVYDEAGHWLGDYDDTGAPIQQAVWLDDLPVGVYADKLYTIEPDHLGTPRAIIDPTRDVVVWRWDLNGEAFGSTQPNQNPDLDGTNFVFNLRYPGQRYDSATGLNYNYFRDYDPGTGRYVQSDPIGLKGGVSTFGYVGESPLMWKDTYGLVRWDGTAMPASAGSVLAAGAYVFDLTSQCVKGRKARVLVRAWGVGFGIGIKYLPITSSAGSVTFEDHLSDIFPSNFNGLFGTLGGSIGVGGCTGYQIGDEWTPAVTKNPASCSWGVDGVDLGGGIQIGKSTLVGLKWEKCSDCGPIDTPFK